MNQLKFYWRRGLLYTLAGALCKIVPEQLIRFRYFVVFRLNETHDEQTFSTDVRCKWCATDDEFRLAENLSRFKRERFESPLDANLAFLADAAVGAFWVSKDWFDERELGIRLELNQHQRWLFGAMVDKSYRGKKIFPQILRLTSRSLQDEGVDAALAAVNPLNKASMAVFTAHSGVVGRVIAFKILNFSICVGSGSVIVDRLFSANCKKKPILWSVTN